MFESFENIHINDLETVVSENWNEWLMKYPKYSVGQLADFLIVALYKYFEEDY